MSKIQHKTAYAALALPCLLLFCDLAWGQAAYPDYAATSGPQAFSIPSPHRGLSKTRQLLNSAAAQVSLFLNYQESQASDRTWKTEGLPGLSGARYFTKSVGGGTYRTVEAAILPDPKGGYELYFYGTETYADHSQAPNPDLATIQTSVQTLVQGVRTKLESPGMQDLGYQAYHFSYLQSDRAIALLKSLGFTTIEYSQQAGETANDRIYAPIQNGQWRLPVIVKMIDATKTSLMDPAPAAGGYGGQQQQGYGQTYSAVPDIGGTFLHQMTSGEPQQRVLIIYNKNDPEPMESLLNLLREKIDVPARQIVIEALVIEINTDRLKDIGMSIRAGKDDYDISFEEDQAGNALPFTFTFDRNRFGDILFFRTSLRALITSGDAELLSSPSVLVLDGRQARIQVGQQVPVVKSTATSAGITSSVDYFPVGIVLNLRPRISEDGTDITMQVETIVSAVNQAASGRSGDVFFAPTVDNRQVQTFVRVADNTPFIIGGLISTDKQEKSVGIPILSQIPILGIPFRRKIIDNEKKEVIVVLTPHVVPLEEKSFSYVIPKDSDIFNAFGYKLFRNAYRIRDDDVFDLRFVYESDIYSSLLTTILLETEADIMLKKEEPFASLAEGAVPGEEILVRRMLWEVVLKTNFTQYIDVNRMILLEDKPAAPDSSGFQIAFLNNLLARRDQNKQNTLRLSFEARPRGTPKHPFVPPQVRDRLRDHLIPGRLHL